MGARGFTLIEVLLALAVIGTLAGVAAPIAFSAYARNDLDIASASVARAYRRAQQLARAGDGDDSWGVAIGSTTITLFRGANFVSRDPAYDEVTYFPPHIAPTGLLSVVFAKFTGDPQEIGTTTLASSAAGSVRTVALNAKGGLSFAASTSTPDTGGGGGGGGTASANQIITNDWGTGYCATVTITTSSISPVAWSVSLPLDTYPLNGVPYDVWNATWTYAAQTLTASGVGWNSMVSLSTPQEFGYCANRPSAPENPANATVSITGDWGSGYCANVTITSDSVTPISWDVDIDLSTYPKNGTPYNVWNATWSFASHTLSASGVGWNSEVSAGSPQRFGFCANR